MRPSTYMFRASERSMSVARRRREAWRCRAMIAVDARLATSCPAPSQFQARRRVNRSGARRRCGSSSRCRLRRRGARARDPRARGCTARARATSQLAAKKKAKRCAARALRGARGNRGETSTTRHGRRAAARADEPGAPLRRFAPPLERGRRRRRSWKSTIERRARARPRELPPSQAPRPRAAAAAVSGRALPARRRRRHRRAHRCRRFAEQNSSGRTRICRCRRARTPRASPRPAPPPPPATGRARRARRPQGVRMFECIYGRTAGARRAPAHVLELPQRRGCSASARSRRLIGEQVLDWFLKPFVEDEPGSCGARKERSACPTQVGKTRAGVDARLGGTRAP